MPRFGKKNAREQRGRSPREHGWSGVRGQRQQASLPTSQGVWRSTVSSPSRVSGGAPAEVEFGARETWHVCWLFKFKKK